MSLRNFTPIPFEEWLISNRERVMQEYDPLPACHYDRYADCEECRGKGWIGEEEEDDEEQYECDGCEGSGRVELSDEELFRECAWADYEFQVNKDRLKVARYMDYVSRN